MDEKRFLELLKKKERKDYVTKDVSDVYNMVAEKTGRTPEEIAMIGGVESQHGKYSKNFAGSPAKGLFQITPSIKKTFSPEGSLEDYNVQEQIMIDLINEHQKKIPEKISDGDLYILHNLGLSKGKKLLKADENKQVKDILPSNIIEQNDKFYKDKTVGEAKKSIKDMLEERGEELPPEFMDVFKEQRPYRRILKKLKK